MGRALGPLPHLSTHYFVVHEPKLYSAFSTEHSNPILSWLLLHTNTVWPGQAADSRGSGTYFSEVSFAASHFECGHLAPQIFLDMLHGDTNSSSDARTA
jgi:hypothetical protein